jgi:hypothetical protein
MSGLPDSKDLYAGSLILCVLWQFERWLSEMLRRRNCAMTTSISLWAANKGRMAKQDII